MGILGFLTREKAEAPASVDELEGRLGRLADERRQRSRWSWPDRAPRRERTANSGRACRRSRPSSRGAVGEDQGKLFPRGGQLPSRGAFGAPGV